MNSRERTVQIMVDMYSVFGYPNLTDRNEEQLMVEFGISKEDAQMLWSVVHEDDPDRDTYRLPKEKSEDFLECIQETLHQGILGHTDAESMVIRSFLSDITYGVSLMSK